MSLRQPNVKDVAGASNRSRGGLLQSGVCSRCASGCDGNCEVFQASFRGRELLNDGHFREAPGGDEYRALDYSHLSIQGQPFDGDDLCGSIGFRLNMPNPPVVSTQVEYGWDKKVKMAVPVFSGALGTDEVARTNWEHFAAGAAISGITLRCSGNNIYASDPELKLDAQGRVIASPEMDRRIESYRRYHRGLGELLVQFRGDDVRLGTADYVLDKHGLDTIEIAWGRGTRLQGGESRSDSLPVALQWQQQGHSVAPNPSDPRVQEAYHDGCVPHFERHRRLGFLDQDAFLQQCDRLRRLGFQRIMLHTRICGLPDLALALKWASLARIDLLTIGGVLGRASPRRTTSGRGMPSLYLHSAAVQFADRLARKGQRVPDLALTGGFCTEEQLFKALALGSPYVRAVCMDQALMIPGVVGRNVGHWMNNGGLPKTVSQYGENLEEIFVCWQQVARIVGREEMPKIPLGAVGIYSYVQKLAAGVERLMAGVRSFSFSAVRRSALVSLTHECAEVTGVPYVMDACRSEAEAILDA